MKADTPTSVPYETYLSLEAESDTKYEYHDGFIVAMAGGTPRHSQICSNAERFIGNALDANGRPCIVYNSDLKVRVESVNRTYYPDATVGCEEALFSLKDRNALINPILIVEVLSEGTEERDRGIKFFHYRKLESLQEYVTISQQEPEVNTYYRQDDNIWEIKTTLGLEATVEIKSLGVNLRMQDLYRLVKFEDGTEE